MPSSINIFVVLLAVAVTACATTKKPASKPGEAVQTQTYLDWLPLEARLADLGSPVDEATRDQVVALKIAVQEREHELGEWIVPLLNSYLPRGDKLRGRVVFEIGRSVPVEVTPNGIAYVDVTAPLWKTDAQRLWREVVGALYRCALSQALPVRLDEPNDADSFADLVLSHQMLDGLATLVSAQGAPINAPSTPDAPLMLRDEKTERFQLLEGYMAQARSASKGEIQALWKQLLEGEPETRLLGITGAAMAEAIEARESRVVLMDTVSLGHRAFYNAYMEGRPGALMSFHLPPDAVAPVDELPPPPVPEPDSAH